MKSFVNLLVFFAFSATYSYSQIEILQPEEKRASATFGILQGVGALVGVDLELLATDRFGIQADGG